MDWKLFLDDERYPTDNTWVIARNFDDAVWYIKNYGVPKHMSLDHDLGANKYTGYDFVKWFCDSVMYGNFKLPHDFSYYVHSQNPVGAENMNRYFDNFFEYYVS